MWGVGVFERGGEGRKGEDGNGREEGGGGGGGRRE